MGGEIITYTDESALAEANRIFGELTNTMGKKESAKAVIDAAVFLETMDIPQPHFEKNDDEAKVYLRYYKGLLSSPYNLELLMSQMMLNGGRRSTRRRSTRRRNLRKRLTRRK